MTTRTEYIEQFKRKLDEWNTDITKWEEKARLTKNDMQIEYEMQLENLRKYRDQATEKLKEVQAGSDAAWQDLKSGTDAAWTALREAFDKAASHFRK